MAESISIDASRCTGCGLCAQVCWLNFELGPDGKARPRQAPLLCAACGHCAAVCPADAITHPRLAGAACEPLDESLRPDYESFLGFLKMRRSRREFTDRTVPRETIAQLLAAGAQAPNGLNRRNVRYTVITDRAVLAELSTRVASQMKRLFRLLRHPAGRLLFRLLQPRALRDLAPFLPLAELLDAGRLPVRDWVAYGAPCAILVHTPEQDLCGAEDAVYAAANIQYAAETLGLGTCVIGFITGPVNADRGLRELVRLPAGHKVHTTLVAGYPRFRYRKAAPKAEPSADYL